MSTRSSSTTVPTVRTYAGDLDFVRSHKSNSNNTIPPTTAKPAAVVISPAQTPVKVASVKSQDDSVIPPFHTFSKPETTSAQGAAQKILTATSNLSQNGNLKEDLPAVVITDTKRKRFKLSTAIADSIQDWWADKKENVQKKKIPRYTVPEAERRKGVIQKATAKTGRTSSDDHATVVSRIKASKQTVPTPRIIPSETIPEPIVKTAPAWETTPVVPPSVQKPIVITPIVPAQPIIKEVPVTPTQTSSWESDIQTKANALREPQPVSNLVLTGKEFSKIKQQRQITANEASVPTITPIVPKAIPQLPTAPIKIITPIVPEIPKAPVVPITPPVYPTVVPPVVPVSAPSIQNAIAETAITPTPISLPKIVPIVPSITTEDQATSNETVVYLPTEGLNSITPISPIETASTTPPTPRREERRFAPPKETRSSVFDSLTQTNPIVFGTFGLLIFVIGSGLILRSYLTAPDDTVVPIQQPTSAVFTATPVYTDTVVVTTVADIANALGAQKTTADSLTEITMLGPSQKPLTSTEFFSILNTQVVFDFKSTITGVAAGTYRDAIWFSLSVADKNTAFGGALAWEKTMAQDLQFMSGVTQVTNVQFTDSIINTIDVRVLKNSAGEDQLIYGFINGNTLLITTNETAFLNLANQI